MVVCVIGLGSLGEFITGIATLALAATAFFTVVGANDSFLSQSREKRGRWLADLHTRFTTEPSFKSTRQQLYNGEQSELHGAVKHVHEREADENAQPLSRAERELIVELDDYLDFFSLIWHLIDNNQLDSEDAYNLFSWYALDPFEVAVIETEITRNYPYVKKLGIKFERMNEERGLPTRSSPPRADEPA
jgi:hypothetical protein